MKTTLFLSLLLLPYSSHAQTFTFKDHGKEVAAHDINALGSLAQPQEVQFHHNKFKTEKTYEGFLFRNLLDKVYGKAWRSSEMLLFTCSDGYQPVIATEDILRESKDHEGYLAFKEVGHKGFPDFKKKGKMVNPGPFYLIWKNVHDQPASPVLDWPYQVIGVDLIAFEDKFPNLAPPSGSKKSVRAGFLGFRQNCIQCHTLNGNGSPVSFELNYPVNVTEYFNEKWLKKFILNPQSVRARSQMLGISAFPNTSHLSKKEQEKLASNIIAYLRAMKRKKIKPKE